MFYMNPPHPKLRCEICGDKFVSYGKLNYDINGNPVEFGFLMCNDCVQICQETEHVLPDLKCRLILK